MMRTVVLLTLLFSLPCLADVVASTIYDSDTGANCTVKAAKGYCTKDPHTYFECPMTCAKLGRPKDAAWGGFDKKESPFHEFKLRDYQGKRVNFEDFEGEIVIVALVPMFPGMAQFHYDLLNHVLDVYQYGVHVVFVPMQGQDGIVIEPTEGSKIRILEGVNNGDHPLVRYLNKFIQPGRFEWMKLNAFIVGPLGNRITLHMSPDIKTYRKFVDDEFNEMQAEL